MSDIYQCLSLATIQAVFPEELEYIRQNRFHFAEHKSDWLLLLNSNRLSLAHLVQIHNKIIEENKAKENAEKANTSV
jgi:hypothetical protein